ncbi:MAG: acetyltransferase, family [Gemmatimonadetes bacterium]|nr:acetyltransferase, family [Gemmatimonadota bacterium]
MPPLREARLDDAPRLTALINEAFVVERSFKNGDRTTQPDVEEHLGRGCFLLLGEPPAIDACVYVDLRPEGGYFGMLSVDPARQGAGLGRLLIDAAEQWCRDREASQVEIMVADVRPELRSFYAKLGYEERHMSPFLHEGLTKEVKFVHMVKPL